MSHRDRLRCASPPESAVARGPDPRRRARLHRPLGRRQDHPRRRRPRGRLLAGPPSTACFPGGKAALIEAAGQREVARFLAVVAAPPPSSGRRARGRCWSRAVAGRPGPRARPRAPAVPPRPRARRGAAAPRVRTGRPPVSRRRRCLAPRPRPLRRRPSAPLGRRVGRPRSSSPTCPHPPTDARPRRRRRRPPPGRRPSCCRRSPHAPSPHPEHAPRGASDHPCPHNEELIGRADINDLEAILSVTNTDVDEVIHAVKDNADAIFTWDYEKGARPALNQLYEKAKTVEVERRDRPAVGHRGRPGGGRDGQRRRERRPRRRHRPHRHAVREVGRQGVDRARHRVPELDALPVHARRAGRAASAPPRSSRRCRGSTPSTTRRPR